MAIYTIKLIDNTKASKGSSFKATGYITLHYPGGTEEIAFPDTTSFAGEYATIKIEPKTKAGITQAYVFVSGFRQNTNKKSGKVVEKHLFSASIFRASVDGEGKFTELGSTILSAILPDANQTNRYVSCGAGSELYIEFADWS